MSDAQNKKKPWGDAMAIIEKKGMRDNQNAVFLPLGAVWENANGNLNFTLDVEPVAWRGSAPRRICIVKRNADNTRGKK